MHRYTKGIGKLRAHIGRRLAGSPDVEALLLVQINQSYVRFQRNVLCRWITESSFKHAVRLGKGFVHVASAQLEVIADIGLLPGFDMGQISECLGRSMPFMDERRLRLYRIKHIDN